ncbi:13720_t:CDS:2 [Dentiscutata heterogama]|uniref:13720_t:CDS:1 n=1 Tax=Dentiscutata heterogama TaxID=1316150 RepID=A0ACA9LBX1_9GLOM|nr:13720_t:CDS:2 [Dentiscutata heterogama]
MDFIYRKFFDNKPSEGETLTQLFNKCKRGFIFNGDKPKKADINAFEVDKYEINLTEHFSSFEIECSNELEIFCSTNFILDGKFKAGLSWLSVFLGVSHNNVEQKLVRFETFVKYSCKKWERAEVKIPKSCIKPTEKFISDVKTALSKGTNDEKLNALLKLTETYGSFYTCRLVFGKAEINEIISENSSSESSKTNVTEVTAGIESGLHVNASTTVRTENNRRNRCDNKFSKSKSLVIGNDDLSNYAKWDIIAYDEIYLIFDLLENDYSDLRKEILDILGQRILSAGVSDIIEYDFATPFIYPLETKLTKVEDIHKCHIFASIMNENAKTALSLRVEYEDEYTPIIVVHLIQHKYKKKLSFFRQKKNTFSFKLGWIIVGQPKNFDFDLTESSYPVILRSYTLSNLKMENNRIRISFDKIPKLHEQKLKETCILSTCVLKLTSENESSKQIIIGAHVSPSIHSVCLFAYNHDSEMNCVDENILQNLSLYFCTVDVNNSHKTFEFGQTIVKWRQSHKQPNMFYGCEDPCDKNIFPGNEKNILSSFLANSYEQGRVYGNQIILVNQLVDCSTNCEHGSVNVNLNEVIFGSFKSECMKCNIVKIAYMIVTPKK